MTAHDSAAPTDTQIDAVIRELDPAPGGGLTPTERIRAEALLERIVATPPPAAPSTERVRHRRRAAWLLAPVGVALAGMGGAALLSGGGSAFATWTPTPEPLTGAVAAQAGETCQATDRTPSPARSSGGGVYDGAQVTLAEQRGTWVYVELRSATHARFCVMPADLIGEPNPGDLTREGFLASGGPDVPANEAPLRPDEVVQGVVQEGSVPTGGRWRFRSDEAWISVINGRVGSDVASLTVRTPSGEVVEASVARGRFAVWWPSTLPSSANDGWSDPVRFTVTLNDGSRREFTP